MPYAHALLALLAEQPGYAWQLRKGVEATLGTEWGGASHSHIYAILNRMLKDGLITATPYPSADHRPDITMHEITDAGRAELARWMDEPTTRTAGYRDDFALKVLAAALHGTRAVRGVCDRQRRARMAELQSLHALRAQHPDDAMTTWTIDVAINYVEADILAVDAAETRAAQIAREVPRGLAQHLAGAPDPAHTARSTRRRRDAAAS